MHDSIVLKFVDGNSSLSKVFRLAKAEDPSITLEDVKAVFKNHQVVAPSRGSGCLAEKLAANPLPLPESRTGGRKGNCDSDSGYKSTIDYPRGIVDEATAREWHNKIIDRVIKTRFKRQYWECSGFAPLDTSHEQFARPVIKALCGLDENGLMAWHLSVVLEWFCD
jgi:hypothetical protein